MFQSTHPRRVWQLIRLVLILIVSFNPHTHAGCDLLSTWLVKLLICFNPHTHAGCDFFEGWNIGGLCCFNPHTHAGCDIGGWSSVININVSIHTPTQGVTHTIRDFWVMGTFQSTHPRRVWPMAQFNNILLVMFQSTHPRRVWLLEVGLV